MIEENNRSLSFEELKKHRDKMSYLQKKFAGKDCIILTGGPSIKKIDKQKLKEFLRNKLVICAKQTINLCPNLADIHIINDCNYDKYDYSYFSKNPIKVLIKSPAILNFVPFFKPDLTFRIQRKNCQRDKSISYLKNFSDWEIDSESDLRPWGPGIIHEICIHLPIFFKSKSVTFIGWDIGEKNKNSIKRFYEKEDFLTKLRRFISEKHLNLYNVFYVRIENLLRLLLFFLGFKVTINLPGVTEGESDFISSSTHELYDYYKKNNIEAYIVSDSSLVSDKFPRIKI